MIACDGSADGLDALERLASLGPNPDNSVVTLVVGWPPRGGVMWQDVYERQLSSDDLHRALVDLELEWANEPDNRPASTKRPGRPTR